MPVDRRSNLAPHYSPILDLPHAKRMLCLDHSAAIAFYTVSQTSDNTEWVTTRGKREKEQKKKEKGVGRERSKRRGALTNEWG